jgi:hypothetical protein
MGLNEIQTASAGLDPSRAFTMHSRGESSGEELKALRPPALQSLILLGTVHNDPTGFRELGRFLRSHQPDCVFVELSPYALRFRLRHRRTLQRTLVQNLQEACAQARVSWQDAMRHPEIVAVRKQIGLPSEYRAAARYAAQTGSKIFPVDYSLFSRKWLASWPELLSSKNLSVLLSLPPNPRSVSRIYDSAAVAVAGVAPGSPENTAFHASHTDPLWVERELHMAKAIMRLCEIFSPQKPVYLGGWRHLTPCGEIPTLRDILNIPPARCLLLDRWEASQPLHGTK